MQLNILLLILTMSLYSTFAEAKNYLGILGGGGEPAGNTTLFDDDLKFLSAFKSQNWETTATFNGGHAYTESILEKNFPGTTSFTADNFNNTIENYEKKILSGQITSSDQLMIVVDSHGAEKDSTKQESTHKIILAGEAIVDYDKAGKNSVSLDKLQRLTELAKEKNIKLAIVDLSCHSGLSLSLANSNTCVISATGPDNYAYNKSPFTFPQLFLKNLSSEKNLESAFLEARKSFQDASFPMISTLAGTNTNDEIYDLQAPYLNIHLPNSHKFINFMKANLNSEQCLLNENEQSLNNLLNQITKINSNLISSPEIVNFKIAVSEYNNYMLELKKKFNALPKIPEDIIETCTKFTSQTTPQINCWKFTIKEILNLDPDIYLADLNRQLESPKEFIRASAKAGIENIAKIKEKKAELILQNPDYFKRDSFFNDQEQLDEKTKTLANNVSLASRDLYQVIYKQKQNKTDPNPCKDFILNK